MSKRDELQRLLREIHAVQEQHKGRRMSEKIGRWSADRGKEALALQQESTPRAATLRSRHSHR